MDQSGKADISINRLPANDAHLIQLVRGRLGTEHRVSSVRRINVSSCKFVVTLHGRVPDFETRTGVEITAREAVGVRDVVNKLRVPAKARTSVFPRHDFGVSRFTEYSKIPE